MKIIIVKLNLNVDLNLTKHVGGLINPRVRAVLKAVLHAVQKLAAQNDLRSDTLESIRPGL